MKAQDTIMPFMRIEEIDARNAVSNFTDALVDVAREQAEITWDIAFKAGKKEFETEIHEVMEVARAALLDATYCVDGLDGATGEAVMNWLTELLGDKEEYHPVIEGLSEQTKWARDKAITHTTEGG